MKTLLTILTLFNLVFSAIGGRQAVTDTATVASFAAFIAAKGDTNATIAVSKGFTFTSNFTLAKTKRLSVKNNARINLGGYTFTIKNMEDVPDSTFVGSGTIIFDTCAGSYFRQRWIGSSALTFVVRGCPGDTVIFKEGVKTARGFFDQLYIWLNNAYDEVGRFMARSQYCYFIQGLTQPPPNCA